MDKGQEGANVEACYEFGNKSNENVFQTQNKIEGDHRINYIRIV
jgi:ribulose bisphosphate carboxylase small subunit